MLSKKMEIALNEQINAELWSAYLYLSMSSYFAADGKQGFANWMHIQFQEEQDHAMKILNFIIARGGKVALKPIAEVKTAWHSPLEVFEQTLAHEKIVTGLIDDLYTLATDEKDYATQAMLTWFINEQVEEEEAAQSLIDALIMIKDNGFGIYTLDKELGSRTYTPITKE